MIRDVAVRSAGNKGFGVFALKPFASGEFIFRRRNARPISAAETANLSAEDRMHLTELGWDRFAVVQAPGAYLNHSCDPNAMRRGVVVFAWRDINLGDEITIDYRLNAFGGDSWPCACGSANCKGIVIGSFFALDQATQRAYLPHAPEFIRREFRIRERKDSSQYGRT